MICVSLAGLSFKECIEAIGQSEFAEIRMDQLNLSLDEFGSLFSLKKNLIATCRSEHHTTEQRIEKLKKAIDSGAGYIDIEYESENEYREILSLHAHKRHTLIIISYHNFECTPSSDELDIIIQKSLLMKPDYIKITTMSNSIADNTRVLALYERYPNIIAFCMGKPGKITRVAAPLLGAKFTYAAYNKELATAPGQLTKEELSKIYELMEC